MRDNLGLFVYWSIAKAIFAIKDIEKRSVLSIFDWLKNTGKASNLDEIRRFYKSKPDAPVFNTHEYSKLFKGLDEGVEIYEVYLRDTNRLFYYVDDATKIIYCVGIRNAHLETGKNRR